jgi:hypothetical protein
MLSSAAVPSVAARHAGSHWLVPLLVSAAVGLLYTINLDRLPAPDELHHVLAARGLLETGEPRIAEGLYTRTLLHTWFVAESFQLLGDSVAAARVPSVICMAVLVGLFFAWLRREAGIAAAWTGTVLFALSPMAIDIAQFARFYAPQSLMFFIAALLIYETMAASKSLRQQILLVALALPCLLLAIHFQPTSLIGIMGLGLWSAGVLGVPWLISERVPRRRKLAVAGALAVTGLILLAGLTASGLLGELWHRYRWTPLFDRATANEFWFYHARYSLLYPSLWPLTGILGLIAVTTVPRPAIFALVVFGVGVLLNSFGGPKSLHYIAYAQPFLFIIWAIGLASLWPSARHGTAALAEQLAAVLDPLGRQIARLLIASAVMFLLLANPAWIGSIALLADITVPPQRPKPDWPAARAALMPWIDRADVVVTTEELGTLYFLGHYDIRFSRSKLEELSEGEQRDFGRDHRTGRPVIGSAEALERVFACYGTGIILGPLESWNKPHVISPDIARLITERVRPLALPPRSRVYAYVWEHASSPPADVSCAGLPTFRDSPSHRG